MIARVDFFADLPVARRLTPSVTLTDPLAFFSARLTAADGFSVTDLLPAPAHLTVPEASVVDFSPSFLATLRRDRQRRRAASSPAVQVTLTARPLLVNVATVVLAGLLTPNHGATGAAGAASGPSAPRAPSLAPPSR